MLFKKKEKAAQTAPTPYGYSLPRQPQTKCTNRALLCALKGLFIFSAVFGAIGGLISSFSLPCHLMIIAALFLFFSILMAFLHYNRLIFNLCYPLVFFLFAYGIFTYRYQVNSGYQAFASILQEEYSTYYDLSILREATEYYADRTMTITFAAVFIGFFLIVLLNIAISEYMSLPLVILLTFPIFQLGIFIQKTPALPYFILLLFSYFMVGITKRSKHFLYPYRDKNATDFSFRAKNGQTCYRYHASGRIMLQLTCFFFLFVLLTGCLSLPFLSAGSSSSSSALRKKADEYVKIFTQSGLSGFFNRYEASGGLSEGKLGGVSSVRPDYQTDLTLTFVPYSDETIYLRAFIGGNYTGSSWSAPDFGIGYLQELFSGSSYDEYETYTAFLEARRHQYYTEQNENAGIYGKFEITNVDANENYIYIPYYTTDALSVPYTVSRGILSASLPKGSSFQGYYYPLLHDYWLINAQPDELRTSLPASSALSQYIAAYDQFNETNYIDVPYRLQEDLEQFQTEIGYGDSIDDIIILIQKYLDENYTYSMTPGSTPLSEDFALYFLEKQKTGYCAHFATAAALLLRSYGIPARYVEGYAVSFAEVTEGSSVDADYEEWFTGENPLGQSGVVSVNVTDADAHAWVEVYKEGIGWVPYDFTPADDETPDTDSLYSDFWGLFSGIFSPSGNAPQLTEGTAGDVQSDFRLFTESDSFILPVFLFAVFLSSLCLLIYFGRLLAYAISRRRAYRKGQYGALLSYSYKKLCRRLQKKKIVPAGRRFILPSELACLLTERMDTDSSASGFSASAQTQITMQLELLEKCLYSQHTITKKEADTLLLFLKKQIRLLK